MAMMNGQFKFEVTVKKMSVVAPENPIQDHYLPLSNLDLLLPPIHPTSFYCYKKPIDERYTYDSMVNILKNALAKTLVPYYPLAGEMVENVFGEPEIYCNSRGIDFVEAYADIELIQLNFFNPDQTIRGNFVPTLHHGIYAVKATELKCGGMVLGFALDHRVSDAYSVQMFIHSWIEAAQNKPFSRIPSFRRSLLFPVYPGRRRRRHDSLVKDFYIPVSALLPTSQDDIIEEESHDDGHGISEDQAISRIYYIEGKVIEKLQSMANEGEEEKSMKKKRSKFVAFSAFLWKILSSSIANHNHDKICRLGVVVDGRSRLGAGDDNKLKPMLAYYGNVVSIPFCEKKCELLQEKPLNLVADEVHDFLAGAATMDHFLGLLDFVEAHRPEPVVAKICATKVQGLAIVVSAGHQFPVAEMDFGWGSSRFSSNYFPWGGESGYVGTMPSLSMNGDWIVYMYLLKEQLDFLEMHAAHVFKPLTSAYLNLSNSV